MNRLPGIGFVAFLALILLGAMAGRADASSARERQARADSIRHLVLAMDLLRAPDLARAHRAEVEAATDASPGELFAALVLDIDAHNEARPRDEARTDSLFARLRTMADGPPSDPRRHGTIARLTSRRFHSDARHDSSRAWIVRADSLFRSAGATEEPEYAAVLLQSAFTLRGAGRMASAESLLVQAAGILERECGADSDSLWDVLGVRASNFVGPGSAGRSFALLTRALEMQRRLFGPRALRLVHTLYTLAGIEMAFGLNDRADRTIQEGLAISEPFRSVIPRWRYATILDAQSWVLELRGEFAASESVLVEAIAASATEAGTGPLLHQLANLAFLRIEQGEIDAARADLARMDTLLAPPRDTTDATYVRYLEANAWIAFADGDTARVARLLARMDAIEARGPARSTWSLIHRSLTYGWLAWLSGDSRGAIRDALEAEALGHRFVLDQAFALSDDDALLLRAEGSDGLAMALTAIRHPDRRPVDVTATLDAVVRARGFLLEAILSRRRDLLSSTDDSTRSVLDRLAALRTERANTVLSAAGSSRDAEITRLRRQERVLLGELETREPALSRIGQASFVGLSDVRAQLAEGEALCSYVRFEARGEPCGSARDRKLRAPRYAAFIARASEASDVAFVDLGPAAPIDSLVDRWRSMVADRTTARALRATRLRDTGDALRRLAFDPVRAAAGDAAGLCIVPDGALAFVPFEMLPDGAGTLLAERERALRFITAERDLLPQPGDRTPGERGLLALGGAEFGRVVPVKGETPTPLAALSRADESLIEETGTAPPLPLRYDPGPCAGEGGRRFGPLPQTGIEARELGTMARRSGVEPLVLTGNEASEDAFKRLAPGRAYVHVASHGFWLADSCRAAAQAGGSAMLRSGLVLAGANAGAPDPVTGEDGILTAEEIGALDLRGARAVVLSACESGLGQSVDWEGLIGLRHAFRAAGAGAVVTSLWRVDDRSTRLWMRAFYEDLWTGSGELTQAGRHATRAMIARERALGREPDPFTCGAFVVAATGPGR